MPTRSPTRFVCVWRHMATGAVVGLQAVGFCRERQQEWPWESPFGWGSGDMAIGSTWEGSHVGIRRSRAESSGRMRQALLAGLPGTSGLPDFVRDMSGDMSGMSGDIIFISAPRVLPGGGLRLSGGGRGVWRMGCHGWLLPLGCARCGVAETTALARRDMVRLLADGTAEVKRKIGPFWVLPGPFALRAGREGCGRQCCVELPQPPATARL